ACGRRRVVPSAGHHGGMSTSRRRCARGLLVVALSALVLSLLPAAASIPGTGDPWRWPVAAPREVAEPFLAPAHDYGPGHRGIDIIADIGVIVRAPANG